MSGVESLIYMHREDMVVLRGEVRQARKDRKCHSREMDQAFKEMRAKLAAEMHETSTSSRFRGAMAFMSVLLTVLSI
ncbi:hypothetical protein [Maridesulfovibrio hydrothermalis]|uniref:Uncharacterized protein n=1 Tax=Maridesulfovibrio hydrothermalis AM13 = DSM 14728 TaxID=1121451 RepID=L0RAY8_9BACT|nr:hypothetical protein [Maridesulfovibrio hydrothermalis]CCO23360.1 conserved protein of unknown function [Maridesulfovibrio hydrothermalis AM13 = DSM 14728]